MRGTPDDIVARPHSRGIAICIGRNVVKALGLNEGESVSIEDRPPHGWVITKKPQYRLCKSRPCSKALLFFPGGLRVESRLVKANMIGNIPVFPQHAIKRKDQ